MKTAEDYSEHIRKSYIWMIRRQQRNVKHCQESLAWLHKYKDAWKGREDEFNEVKKMQRDDLNEAKEILKEIENNYKHDCLGHNLKK